jgi:hypothetical protein
MFYPTISKKLVSAIPAGLKCETRNSCAYRPFTTLTGTYMRSFSTMSVTSVMLLLCCPARIWGHSVQCLSRLWCFYYAVRHVYEVIQYNVCDAFTTLTGTYMRSLSTMSVTSVMPLLWCLSRLWCLYYDVCHVCDAFTTMSVTSVMPLLRCLSRLLKQTLYLESAQKTDYIYICFKMFLRLFFSMIFLPLVPLRDMWKSQHRHSSYLTA